MTEYKKEKTEKGKMMMNRETKAKEEKRRGGEEERRQQKGNGKQESRDGSVKTETKRQTGVIEEEKKTLDARIARSASCSTQ